MTTWQSDQNIPDNVIVDLLLKGDEEFIDFFFNKACHPLLCKINWKIFNNKLDYIYLCEHFKFYLQQNDWERLRSFRGESSLFGWLKVTAAHLFYNNRHEFLPEQSKPLRSMPLRKRIKFKDAPEDDVTYVLERMNNPVFGEFIRLRHIEGMTDKEIINDILSGAEEQFKVMERKAYSAFKQTVDNLGEYYQDLFIIPEERVIEVDEEEITEEPSYNSVPRTITKIDIEQALSRLDDRDRYILRSLIIEDRKRADIAEELGITPAYLDIVRNRALKKMKKLLIN